MRSAALVARLRRARRTVRALSRDFPAEHAGDREEDRHAKGPRASAVRGRTPTSSRQSRRRVGSKNFLWRLWRQPGFCSPPERRWRAGVRCVIHGARAPAHHGDFMAEVAKRAHQQKPTVALCGIGERRLRYGQKSVSGRSRESRPQPGLGNESTGTRVPVRASWRAPARVVVGSASAFTSWGFSSGKEPRAARRGYKVRLASKSKKSVVGKVSTGQTQGDAGGRDPRAKAAKSAKAPKKAEKAERDRERMPRADDDVREPAHANPETARRRSARRRVECAFWMFDARHTRGLTGTSATRGARPRIVPRDRLIAVALQRCQTSSRFRLIWLCGVSTPRPRHASSRSRRRHRQQRSPKRRRRGRARPVR